MSTNSVLKGSSIILAASDETVRAEAYAHLSLEGWEGNTHFPETLDELKSILKNESLRALVVILESDGTMAQKFLEASLSSGVSKTQIILGVVHNSISHRLMKQSTGIIGFPFEVSITPDGPKIEMDALVAALQEAWHKSQSLVLDNEVQSAINDGSLSFISLALGTPCTEIAKERTHLAAAIANEINGDPRFILRVIRLSLFADIIKIKGWNSIVQSKRSLWVIAELLQTEYDLKARAITVLPSNIELEIAVLWVTKTFQENIGFGKAQSIGALNKVINNMRLEGRIGLLLAIEKCFKKLWVSQRESA